MTEYVRDERYLRFVREHPCLLCGVTGVDAHHVRYMQERGVSMKVGDQYTVPLCREHHALCHGRGDETIFWAVQGVDPEVWMAEKWWAYKQDHQDEAS